MKIVCRQFVAYLYLTSWRHFSLGFHVDFASPNIEIHLPFCFIRFGWQGMGVYTDADNAKQRGFGLDYKDKEQLQRYLAEEKETDTKKPPD
jgi:hypothetical protein